MVSQLPEAVLQMSGRTNEKLHRDGKTTRKHTRTECPQMKTSLAEFYQHITISTSLDELSREVYRFVISKVAKKTTFSVSRKISISTQPVITISAQSSAVFGRVSQEQHMLSFNVFCDSKNGYLLDTTRSKDQRSKKKELIHKSTSTWKQIVEGSGFTDQLLVL